MIGLSGRWVWVFCFEEEHKEEQIKKKREIKKSREERKKRKRKEKREWLVGCDNAWLLGPTISTILQTCLWVTKYEFWKQLKWVFTFPHYHSFFLSHRIMKTESRNPNNYSSVGPTSFGIWVMKIGWYHLVLWVSKQALSLNTLFK